VAGIAINGAALGGWLQAKTIGIGFVPGLDTPERVQLADAVAALLALVALAGPLATVAGRRASASGASVGVAAVSAAALAVTGMVATASHSHSGSHAHARPYTATLPVDLSGVPGVSAEDVSEAEALVTESIKTLPRFADVATLVDLGYRTIGDAHTGYEHFVNWELIADGRVLDPDYPESLVFKVDTETGGKTLNGAMFMANPGDTLDTVPDVGGALVQWHVHEDLCFAGEPNAWWVTDVIPPDQACPPGTFRLREITVPMVHVWIVPQECGPFASLEGGGAGQVKSGEARLCDHAHGAPN